MNDSALETIITKADTTYRSNGRTFGITLPSIEGQEAVIRKAYSKAGVALEETDYVEVRTRSSLERLRVLLTSCCSVTGRVLK